MLCYLNAKLSLCIAFFCYGEIQYTFDLKHFAENPLTPYPLTAPLTPLLFYIVTYRPLRSYV